MSAGPGNAARMVDGRMFIRCGSSGSFRGDDRPDRWVAWSHVGEVAKSGNGVHIKANHSSYRIEGTTPGEVFDRVDAVARMRDTEITNHPMGSP